MTDHRNDERVGESRLLNGLIRFCIEKKLVVGLGVLLIIVWGLMVAPFDWNLGPLPRNPVAVDAIPDIGENQQIVFTDWMGRSPRDVDDQITYPLTTALLGTPGVKTIRSFSMFGFSTIYVIFDENVDFYWSRSRILEKLASLPPGTLPEDAKPTLGPDATALGQVFWYTLEGRDEKGNPAGGFGPQELRSIQDWYVRYALMSSGGVSEVASVGGFRREYQVDVDPSALRAHGVTLEDVYSAVRMSNLDVGARTIEVNRVEYIIRGVGFVRTVGDLEKVVVRSAGGVPIRVADVATVRAGPGARDGALDKEGAEAVGGVVVVRHGANPLEVIKNVKEKIAEISPGLPTKTLPDGTVSRVEIVPFYDRTGLIHETLGTLNSAISQELIVTVLVIVVMLAELGSAFLVSLVLPLVVLISFIAMKLFGVEANIIALSGIAIAIGAIDDMGIILTQNITTHLARARPDESRLEIVFRGASEVGGAVLTAISTTVVGFLPVFAMTGPEGKLFRPLAYTKTFALVASVIVAITVIPPLAHLILGRKAPSERSRRIVDGLIVASGIVVGVFSSWWVGLIVLLFGFRRLLSRPVERRYPRLSPQIPLVLVALLIALVLTRSWLPLGPARGTLLNFLFVGAMLGVLLGGIFAFLRFYRRLLEWCLAHKAAFLAAPVAIVVVGALAWIGFDTVFGFIPAGLAKLGVRPEAVRTSAVWSGPSHAFPGLGKEFMPSLDEGSFLWMPTTMPHASIGEALDVVAKQDRALASIPEVESVVGKIGRVDSALDPAPTSMIETVINYKPEYIQDERGRRISFAYDRRRGEFVRDEQGALVPDPGGRPFRQWRTEIRSPDDIWNEVTHAAQIPGTTSAPKLQPIAARVVMLQSGMRASMGIKIKGPDLESIERVGLAIERLLKEVPVVDAATVVADRIVGKPYLEIDIDREAIARYGLHIEEVQDVIETAIGGRQATTTVEGRERYSVRVRYARELRDSIEALDRVLVATPDGAQVPLSELSDLRYERGPEAIKREDTFLVSYVTFDSRPGNAEVDVVEMCRSYLADMTARGELVLPAGVSYKFAGSYENQIHAQKVLSVILPLSLFIIFLILYAQFKSVPTSALVFSGIPVAWAGGFILLWLYGKPWFLDFDVFGVGMRGLFQVHPVNLSVAVWVGFLALFGIASDDGVVMATYLEQSFASRTSRSIEDVRRATIEAALRRIRPCLMTSTTTILALLPVFTSTGRGADIMLPMAIPSFGGMTIVLISMLVVPVVYCWVKEREFRHKLDTVPAPE